MKLTGKIFLRAYFTVLAVILGICVVSQAQSTNTNTTTITVESTQPVAVKERVPALTFWLDRVPELQRRVMDVPLWQFLAFAIYVGLAIIAAKIFDYLVTVQLKKLTSRTKTTLDDLFIQLLHGPVRVLAFVILLKLGLDMFVWPLWIEKWLTKGLKVIVAISWTYLALKLVDLATQYWRAHPVLAHDKSFNDLLLPLLSKSLKAFVLVMAILLTLDSLQFNIRTLLAGVSISGLALGLAAQDTIGNLFGAAAVFIDKPFRIGDRIQLNGIDGTVEEIGLRSTRVRNLDGFLVTVPNKTMGNATITNVTRRPNIKMVTDIGLTYDTPPEKVREALAMLNEIYKSLEHTHDVTVAFNRFADSALNINVVLFWKNLDWKGFIAAMNETNVVIMQRFQAAGISMAFPTRTVYLRQEGDWKLENGEKQEEKA